MVTLCRLLEMIMTHSAIRTRAPLVGALSLIAVTVAACATHAPTQTGFLSSYAELPSAVSANDYQAVIIEPVVFETADNQAAPAGAETATQAFAQALTEAFGRHYRIVDTPGQGVMRVRAAVTGYSRANPAWNTAALIVPIGTRNGGVSTEAEVVDSVSGRRIAAQSLSFNGQIWNSSPVTMFQRDAHARSGFRRHAEALTARIQPTAAQ